MTVKDKVLAMMPSFLRAYARQVEASPLGYRLARGVFWSVAGAVISKGLGIVCSIVVARTLGKVGFGELGIINSTVMMFQIFAGFGLGLTATRYVAEYRQSAPLKAGRIIAMAWMVSAVTGGICAIGMFIFAPWLAAHTLAAPHLSGLLQITAIALFISALNAAQGGALSGFEAFKSIAAYNLIAGLFRFPLMVAGVLLAGLKGAVWAIVVSCAVDWFICHLAVRREVHRFDVPLTFSGCLQELPLLWKFSLPTVLAGMMFIPANWACNAMLVNQPNGYSEMGIWNAALSFQTVLYSLINTVGAPLLPILANGVQTSNERLGSVNMISTWALGTICALPLLFFPEIAEVLYGKQFGGPSFRLAFVLIMFFTCVVIYRQGLGRVLQAQKLMWWGFLSNSFWAIVLIASAYLLVRWGAVGLSISFSITYVIHTIIFIPLYTSRRLVPRNTIISKEALMIWLVILSIILLNYLEVSILIRLLLFPVGLILIGVSFFSLIGYTPSWIHTFGRNRRN